MTDTQIVSTTFELHKDDITNFEVWFRNELGINVKSFSHFNSNSEMYKNDKVYKKLVKKKSEITKEIEIYRNKHS